MLRTIVKYPDSRLKVKCKEIGEITPEIRQLAADMLETMYEADGLGLAAPQVGEKCRLIVMDLSGPKERGAPQILVNPRIVHAEGEQTSDEGCLSVKELRSNVTRAAKVRVEGLDLDGNPVSYEAAELAAICAQHEIDHLDGVLFIDRISRLKRAFYDKKVSKWRKRTQEEAAEAKS